MTPRNNTELPLVSIMIPTYNQAHIIDKAIKSAQSQDYPNLEIIISDDCSTDHTYDEIQRFLCDSRVKYFRNPANLGRVKNYSKTLRDYVNGEWVVNLDGDDHYINDQFISEVLKIILSFGDKNIVFVQGGKIKKYKNKRILEIPNINGNYKLLDGKEYFFNFLKDPHFSHISTVYKRSLAVDIGFYSQNILSSDLESFLRMSLHGKVILMKKAYAEWVQHEENFSEKIDFEILKDNLSYIESVYKYSLNFDIPEKRLINWKKSLYLNNFRNWFVKVLFSDLKSSKKLKMINQIIRYILKYKSSLIFSQTFLLFILKTPFYLLDKIKK